VLTLADVVARVRAAGRAALRLRHATDSFTQIVHRIVGNP
jgi:hypothetical protein